MSGGAISNQGSLAVSEITFTGHVATFAAGAISK